MRYQFNSDGLKSLIKASHLTNKQIAKAINIEYSTMINYIEGRSCPNITNLIKIADYFAVPIDFLTSRCDIQQAHNVLDDYSKNFMILRRAPYEQYLEGRSKFPEYYDINNNYEGESPWPYNLMDILMGEPIDWIMTDKNMAGLDQAISTLNKNQQICIYLYFKNNMTLAAIGKRLDRTIERIRQILKNAIHILSHPSRIKLIKQGCISYEEINKLSDMLKTREQALDKREQKLNQYSNLIKQMIEEHTNNKTYNKYIIDNIIFNFNENIESFNPDKLNMPIQNLDLSPRAYNCLKRQNYNTVRDIIILLETEPTEIHKIPSLGNKTLTEIISKIDEFLGTTDYKTKILKSNRTNNN